MAYIDFPAGNQGIKERKAFWLSPDGLELISGWRREGVPQEEIATKYIGISSRTFWSWTKECKDLEIALGLSQDIVNAKVEQALLKRALGYDVYEEKSELVEGEMRITERTRKHVPPDVKACLSWLYSRRSDRWRAQQEPVDNLKDEVKTAKEILIAIKEVADSGDATPVKPETD
jgi:hypothetical protein